MSALAIRAALEIALAALSPPLDTNWENAKPDFVAAPPYQRVWLMMAEPDNPEMGGAVQDRGIMQITLCYPLDAGPGDAMARAELIRAAFPRGTALTNSGVVTVIEKTPEISPARIEEDQYVVPVRVRFFANYGAGV